MRHPLRTAALTAVAAPIVAGLAVAVILRAAEAADRAKAERRRFLQDSGFHLALMDAYTHAQFRDRGKVIWRPAQPPEWGSWRTPPAADELEVID